MHTVLPSPAPMDASHVNAALSGVATPPPLLFTYPARPINGGNIERARPKLGAWYYEPKYNGWRALVHVPSSTMYNRHGEPLTIGGEFTAALQSLRQHNYEWLDCEALSRRHPVGRGALIVLDAPGLTGRGYAARRSILERDFLLLQTNVVPRDNGVYLPPSLLLDGRDHELAFWSLLKRDNLEIRTRYNLTEDFYEGAVAKRADSFYPVQNRSSSEETAHWIKHRWNF